MILIHNPTIPRPAKVDISLLLESHDEEEEATPTTTTSTPTRSSIYPSAAIPGPTSAAAAAAAVRPAAPPPPPPNVVIEPTPTPTPAALGPLAPVNPSAAKTGIKRLQPAHTAESPAKKQSKWSPDEDALIIELRGSGMKWEDISKRLPGRSAISCRLHYQNYLERRSEWDEDKKNKLARLYERFKAEMWSKIAEEMAIPWRAAEAMHWQLGEQEMARRAGVVPFSLSSTAIDPPATRARRASTSASRPRKGSASSRLNPPQLPSLEELTAGVPAFAPAAPFPLPPRESYRLERPPEYSGPPPGGHVLPGIAFPPRTLP